MWRSRTLNLRTWVQIPPQILNSCLTLANLLNLYGPASASVKWGNWTQSLLSLLPNYIRAAAPMRFKSSQNLKEEKRKHKLQAGHENAVGREWGPRAEGGDAIPRPKHRSQSYASCHEHKRASGSTRLPKVVWGSQLLSTFINCLWHTPGGGRKGRIFQRCVWQILLWPHFQKDSTHDGVLWGWFWKQNHILSPKKHKFNYKNT